MTLKDFEFKADNHFVAMEYYMLILNRTYLVLITNDYLIGLKANGIVSVSGGEDLITKKITNYLSIDGDLTDPYSYLKEKYIKRIENADFNDRNIIGDNKSSFIIEKKQIKKVYYDHRKKWGMGNYPHDGKVYVETNDNKKREFIILGNQSGKRITNSIINY
jgi:hypothetical protein